MPRWTAAVLLAALPTGCCTLLPCAGGFAWRATPASGIVEPGVYTFRVTLDDSETFEPRREVRLPWPDLGYDFRYEFGSLVPAGAGQVAFRAWDRAVICPLPMEARSPVGGSLR